jgi:hypothetical protein
LTQIEGFFKGKDTSRYSMALAQSLDKIRSSIKWLERDRKEVEEVRFIGIVKSLNIADGFVLAFRLQSG